jgi:hypothetical protein
VKVNNVIDVAGAIILLAMLSVVALHPKIVTDVTGGFVNSIKAAKGSA